MYLRPYTAKVGSLLSTFGDDLSVESLRVKQSKKNYSVMYFKLLFAWGNRGNPRNACVKIAISPPDLN